MYAMEAASHFNYLPRGSEATVDAHIACGEVRFPCHRIILASRSKVFKALLLENPSSAITVEGFKSREVEQFLRFAYGEKCEFHDPWTMLELGNKYEVESLKDCCTRVKMMLFML